MQHLELSAEEVEALRGLLESHINEMDVEVDRTDTHDFKEMLKHRRNLLRQILNRLSTMPALM